MDQLESDSMGWRECVCCCPCQADIFARAALIIRARALLEEAMAASATPVRPFLIEVARSRLEQRMATTSTVTLTPPPSP